MMRSSHINSGWPIDQDKIYYLERPQELFAKAAYVRAELIHEGYVATEVNAVCAIRHKLPR